MNFSHCFPFKFIWCLFTCPYHLVNRNFNFNHFQFRFLGRTLSICVSAFAQKTISAFLPSPAIILRLPIQTDPESGSKVMAVRSSVAFVVTYRCGLTGQAICGWSFDKTPWRKFFLSKSLWQSFETFCVKSFSHFFILVSHLFNSTVSSIGPFTSFVTSRWPDTQRCCDTVPVSLLSKKNFSGWFPGQFSKLLMTNSFCRNHHRRNANMFLESDEVDCTYCTKELFEGENKKQRS